jgi:hypothetical protein
MAAFNYGDGAINLSIQARLQDVSGNNKMPLLNRLQKLSKSETSIKWNADTGGATATGEAITASSTTDNASDDIVPASLDIGTNRLRHTFSVQTTKMAEAAAAGEGVLVGMLKLASSNAMRIIVRTLSDLIYTGTGTAGNGGVVGLGALHSAVTSAKSTTTYAGIAPGDHPNWTNYVNTAGTNRALTADLLFKMSEEIIGGGTIGVDSDFTAIYTNSALVTKYKSLFSASSELQAFGGGPADLGYSGLSFEGRPIFNDPRCPANTMYFVDENELYLHTFTEGSFAYGDESPAEGLNMKIVEMARTNADLVQFTVVCKPQLQVARRCAVAVLGAITQ